MATEKVMVIPEHNVSGITKNREKQAVGAFHELEERRNSYVIKQPGSSFEVPVEVKKIKCGSRWN